MDNQVRILDVEVGGRIVEREVTVLADADKRDVHGPLGQQRADARALSRRIGLPSKKVIALDASLLDQPLHQELAEARGVIGRQPDVLIEVKQLDLRPRHVALGGERVEEDKLRRAGRRNDSRVAMLLDRRANQRRRIDSRCAAKRRVVTKNLDAHRNKRRIHDPAAAQDNIVVRCRLPTRPEKRSPKVISSFMTGIRLKLSSWLIQPAVPRTGM